MSSADPQLLPHRSQINLVDRDAATRMNEEALDAAWVEPATRLLRVRDGQLPIREFAEDRRVELELVPVAGERSPAHFYLGRADGCAVFATASGADDEYGEPSSGWRHPFSCSKLPPMQLELAFVALGLVNWHRSMPFSARDGEPTHSAQGGWARLDSHGGEHFPRTDPAVIILVEHEDRVLLGSNVLWETGRFSLLAGFVEAGESAEQAIVREVLEEAGVLVDDVRYVTSQSWPFPRSLMLGFRAGLAEGVDPERLTPDSSEISELRWFTRDELRDPGPGLKLPMGLSIARWLIDLWVNEGTEEGSA